MTQSTNKQTDTGQKMPSLVEVTSIEIPNYRNNVLLFYISHFIFISTSSLYPLLILENVCTPGLKYAWGMHILGTYLSLINTR